MKCAPSRASAPPVTTQCRWRGLRERLAPGVEEGGHTQVASQVFGVPAEGEERVQGRPEEKVWRLR